MSEERKRYEGEEIQKGLEDFIDRELHLNSSADHRNDFDTPGAKTPELDLIGFDNSIHEMNISSEERRPSRRRVERDRYEYEDEEYEYEERRPSRRRAERDRYEYEEEEYEERRPSRRRVERDRYEYEDDDRRSGRSRERDSRKMSEKKKKSKKPESRKSDKNEKKKKKKSRLKGFLVILAILFILVFGGLYMAVGRVYNKMSYEKAEGMDKKPYKENGVINILLIGNDSRLGGDDGRSDAMILVSISDKTKTVTMTSFLRDMYVEIPGHDGNRLNAAYAFGGPELLMETIEHNFDIPVHRYALVNFEAFANLVDAVGGIDLEVTNDEVQLINGYLMEYNQLRGENLDYDWLDPSASGMLHLNGAQALAYTRNRYIGTDFGRTERQRKVLAEVFKKAPMAMVTNGNGVIDGLFPNLTTNLKQSECYNISLNAWKLVGYEMVQQCVPTEGSYTNATIRSMAVLQVDFETNKRFLKETLYGE